MITSEQKAAIADRAIEVLGSMPVLKVVSTAVQEEEVTEMVDGQEVTYTKKTYPPGAEPDLTAVQYQSVLDTMSAETTAPTQTYRELNDAQVKIWVVSDEANLTASQAISDAASTGDLQAKIGYDMLMDSNALDLNVPAVYAAASTMLGAAFASLEAFATNPNEPKWPGLKIGHIQQSIRERLEGKV